MFVPSASSPSDRSHIKFH